MTGTKAVGYTDAVMSVVPGPTPNTEKSDIPDFKSFMNNQSEKPDSATTKAKKTDGSKPDEKLMSAGNDNNVKTEAPTKEREVTESDVDSVKETVEAVEEVISEELDVTIEDIENALAALSLPVVALLDVSNLNELSVELTGSEDMMALVTDGELYDKVKSIENAVTNLLDDLSNELDINPEDLAKAIEELGKEPLEDATKAFDEIINGIKADNEPEVVSLKPENTSVKFEKIEINIKADKDTAKLHNFSIHNEAEEIKVDTKAETSEEFSDKDSSKQFANPMNFIENLVNKTVESLNEAKPFSSYTTIDAADVINQITESIKADVSDGVTEVSLKLHPESLGNVDVKISANNEGALTAKFIAQNDGVKAVIEAQASALKETLESKGVTVEAVEVMVASHEFDENLNREGNNNLNNSGKKKNQRRINLDAGEVNDTTDDDERIAREMMASNGNTIDYSA